MKEEDDAIAAYRRELCEEAHLARADLAEIEDHLRTLAAELRATGMPAGEAIAEAARRLGDPRTVAREHARVRTPFGARLSRARTWSAAVLLLPFVLFAVRTALDLGAATHAGVDAMMAVTLIVGLCTGRTWARPILLGGMAFFLLPTLLALAMWPEPLVYIWLVGQLGVIAFVMPWRRGELAPCGWALALQVWSYGAASLTLGFFYSDTGGGALLVAPAAMVATGAAVAATLGIMLRARWAAIASLAVALPLALAFVELATFEARLPWPNMYRALLLGSMGSAVIASLVASVIGWRHARSTFGSLRNVLRA